MAADTGMGIDVSDRTRVFEPHQEPDGRKEPWVRFAPGPAAGAAFGRRVRLLDSKRGMGSGFLAVVKAPISAVV
jgi:hypothetical protein